MHQDASHHEAHDPEHCWYQGGPFFKELTSHLPFSVLSVALGLILGGVICFFSSDDLVSQADKAIRAISHPHQHDHSAEMDPAATTEPPSSGAGHPHEHPHDHAHEPGAAATMGPAGANGHGHRHGTSGFLILFHLFHPAHMLFSGAATAAMFWRHERSWWKAIAIGLSGSILVCGVSDILMPHASALLMGKQIDLHICIIEHPGIELPFAVIGVAVGILAAMGGTVGSTIFSHSLHVFTSTMASIFYLIGPFGRLEWINQVGTIFIFVVLAVMIPCCLSDIVYPLMLSRRARADFAHRGHHHPH